MTKTVIKLLAYILAGFLLAGLAGTILADQADAAKGDPIPQIGVKDDCINYAEFMGATPEKLNRSSVEAFYGVRGAGKQVSSQNHGKNIIVMYKACGKTTHEAFYEISYARNKAGIYKAGYLTKFIGFIGARKAV